MSPGPENGMRKSQVDDFWYHSHKGQSQLERNMDHGVREIETAQSALSELKQQLSEVQHLLNVVTVDSYVLEDVLQLCHGAAEVLGASTSLVSLLRSRGSAVARKELRGVRR